MEKTCDMSDGFNGPWRSRMYELVSGSSSQLLAGSWTTSFNIFVLRHSSSLFSSSLNSDVEDSAATVTAMSSRVIIQASDWLLMSEQGRDMLISLNVPSGELTHLFPQLKNWMNCRHQPRPGPQRPLVHPGLEKGGCSVHVPLSINSSIQQCVCMPCPLRRSPQEHRSTAGEDVK